MRVVKFIGNWMFMLTAPVWIIPAFIFTIVAGFYGMKGYKEYADVATGKTWII